MLPAPSPPGAKLPWVCDRWLPRRLIGSAVAAGGGLVGQLVIATADAAEDLGARLEVALAGGASGGPSGGASQAVHRQRRGSLECFVLTLPGPAVGGAAARGPGAARGAKAARGARAGAAAKAARGADLASAYYAVASAVRDHIFSIWQGRLARRFLAARYPFFTAAEAAHVLSRVGAELAAPAADTLGAEVVSRVLDCLWAHEGLTVEGFVRFRLKEYVRRVGEVVERAAAEVLLDREYREFLRVLRYFVESQQPRVAELHVQLDPSGARFRLIDHAGRPLAAAARAGRRPRGPGCPGKDAPARSSPRPAVALASGPSPAGPGGGWMPARAPNHEDLLVSTLVTAAPGRIVVHVTAPGADGGRGGVAHDALARPGLAPSLGGQLRALAGVFGGRLVVCPGCPLCRAGQ